MQVYTLKDLSERWGISYPTLLKWVKENKIRSYRKGGIYFVPHHEVERVEKILKEGITMKEAQKILGISRQQIYYYIEKKVLNPIKLGKMNYFKREEILNLKKKIEQNKLAREKK